MIHFHQVNWLFKGSERAYSAGQAVKEKSFAQISSPSPDFIEVIRNKRSEVIRAGYMTQATSITIELPWPDTTSDLKKYHGFSLMIMYQLLPPDGKHDVHHL